MAQPRALKEKFSGIQEETIGFLCICSKHTFKHLPQLKKGRSNPDLGDFFSQIAL